MGHSAIYKKFRTRTSFHFHIISVNEGCLYIFSGNLIFGRIKLVVSVETLGGQCVSIGGQL